MADITQPELSYFHKRMAALGITPELNKILIPQTEVLAGPDQGKTVLKEFTIFRESPKGIEILVYGVDGSRIFTTKDAQRSGITIKAKDKDYTITRLEVPKVRQNGDIQKYDKPSGEPSYPFFPPHLVSKYREQQSIKVLYITEGYFKAFKAAIHGIDCIGLQSITCLRDKNTNELWQDIKDLITTCKVERLVWLTDGDFDNITSKEITEGKDLYTRPNQFYSSAYTFYEITSQLQDVEKYFAHINTETLPEHPKGLDDLLCAYPGNEHDITTEFNNFSLTAPGKMYPGKYITRMNVTIGVGRVRQYILKKDVTEFYLHHVERRPDLKTIPVFKFNGTQYRYNEEKGICEIVVPGDADNYIRAGNDYYKFIKQPDGNGIPVQTITGRAKGTIVDDHGKEFCKHIRKYDNFCIVPDHFNYQQVISNCYNLYNQFTHEPEEGECSTTLEFIKHIFTEELVSYTDKETGIVTHIPRYQLGLDYITLAYKYPQQMLPILCLVSRERQTGKTTFINYIDALFENNAISIGNEDIEADFNAHWAGKLFIMVDETKVDNGKVINKIKRLSTARDIILNSKGKDQVKLPFFAKFILNSNHVEDFIRIDKEEIRFWIHKVPPLQTLVPNIDKLLRDEIPAFLYYLNNRQMVTKQKERHWFDTQLLQTDALTVVKNNSVSGMEKKIRTQLQDLFEISNVTRIRMPLKELTAAIRGAEKDYVKKTLNEMGYKTTSGQYRFPKPTEQSGGGAMGAQTELVQSVQFVTGNSTYYEFQREDFTTVPVTDPMAATDKSSYAGELKKDDLPF